MRNRPVASFRLPGNRRCHLAHLKGTERARYVRGMFGRIAGRYDLLNTAMTAGRHYAWRRAAARMAAGSMTGPALDVATGTGDFAVELARLSNVEKAVGLDFSPEMLEAAGRKADSKRLRDRIDYLVADAHSLPFEDGRFTCAVVGFGIRNFIDVPKAIAEMARVVRPGGRVGVLEIVRMEGRSPASRLLPLCFRYVTPWLGAALAGEREAYTYLPESVQGFMTAGLMADLMRAAGLRNVTVKKMALGSVAFLMGEKAPVG